MAAAIILTGCQPKRTGHRYKPTIDNRSSIMLAIDWGDVTEDGGSIRIAPHETVTASFLSRSRCAKGFLVGQLAPDKPAGYKPPVKLTPEPWCYDQTLIITDAAPMNTPTEVCDKSFVQAAPPASDMPLVVEHHADGTTVVTQYAPVAVWTDHSGNMSTGKPNDKCLHDGPYGPSPADPPPGSVEPHSDDTSQHVPE
jgi:hypothetical protein